MEKYLRLLNPKTTNFEAIPSGGHGSLTAADVCIAMSYAKLTDLENYLFRLYAFGPFTLDKVTEVTEIIFNNLKRVDSLKSNIDHKKCIFIALVELCNVSGDYKPSVSNRALIGGVSRMQIHRKMGEMIDYYKLVLRAKINVAEHKIKETLK
ncbi:hypothetical protein GWP85_11080 [Acinetobacter beijerinckii]|uniref:hypothetical protein n=1 Tax=Acinetobacter beijerinckii TaxID=262668 RepID=UPI0023DDB496|nr:hypothetical protein [Acinetobacter beijerinckii]MDF2418045.1 hypothetical protein [Acinetobacter beijerinckii]